jgi:hypothetical protein
MLKQFISQSDFIPEPLERLYDDLTSRDKKPAATNMNIFTSILKWYSQNFPVYAVFDALDECSEANRKDLIEFLAGLGDAGYKILISSRPHVSIKDQLDIAKEFHIRADESDLRGFVSARLNYEKKVSPNLKARCMELATGADGM